MRTTLRIDDDLFRQAKQAAAESGRTLTQVVEDSLRETFARRQQKPTRKRIVLKTVGGNGVQPGVDLHNSAALLDLMEGVSAAP